MDLATLMFIAYRAMDDQVIRGDAGSRLRVTVAQARIAQRIAEDGSRLTDLAEQAQVTKQTASLLVAALEREGLVERVPDPADGRARLIRLHAEGAGRVRAGSRGGDGRRAGMERPPRPRTRRVPSRGAHQAPRHRRPVPVKEPD